MPSCRICTKDESLVSCIRSRNPLGVIVLVLLMVSGAFVYTAYYISGMNVGKATEKPVSKVLGDFLSSLSQVDWCLNTTEPELTSSEYDIIGQTDVYSQYHNHTTISKDIHDVKVQVPASKIYSVCLELIVVIPGDYYPSFKNIPKFRGDLLRRKLFSEELNSIGSHEMLSLAYLVQHNLSTSMRHSRDVLVPTYINITSHQPLPTYVRHQSSCKSAVDGTDNHTSLVTSCTKAAPKFHVDQNWESDIHVYISVDEERLNIHLLYTSYFLMILAITVTAYSVIRNRNSASKSSSKSKVQQHFVIY